MAFRLWHGLATTEIEYISMKPNWRAVSRELSDDVLWIAKQINDEGSQIAWEIEGDDGSRLN